MKATIRWVAPRFNTHRMLAEYVRRFYNPAAARYRYLAAEAMSRAKAFSRWKSEIRQAWSEFAVRDVTVLVNGEQDEERLNPRQPQLKVGSELNVRRLVKLGRVRPEDSLSSCIRDRPIPGATFRRVRRRDAARAESLGRWRALVHRLDGVQDDGQMAWPSASCPTSRSVNPYDLGSFSGKNAQRIAVRRRPEKTLPFFDRSHCSRLSSRRAAPRLLNEASSISG
jgi:hypothetical protein